MAPLRKDRCANMFRTIGVDFDGYVNVFVCCCTKAIHLKLCSEISTSTFVAAFVGGKGFPHRIVRNNGRNFVESSAHLNANLSNL